MDSLKLGIIGCGGIANNKHLPSIKKLGKAQVTAFCDIVPERAQKAAEEFGASDAKVFEDYRDLLKLDLDAVYVCTPNRSHSFITVDALRSGKHVMCEKPMAINSEEAHKMLSAARQTGKLLTIGYQSRYRADSQYLKRAIQAGELGEIYFARANAVRRRAVPTWGVFLNEHEQGGGPLIDIGTHALDLTLWMMNNYKPRYAAGTTYHKLNKDRDTANAWGDWDVDKFTVEDSAFGFVVMENGATIMLSASWALNTLDVEEATATLSGTKGGADFHDGLRINGVKHGRQFVEKPDLKSGAVAFFEGKASDPQMLEQHTFHAAIRGKGDLCVLPEQALVVTRILEAIYKSAASGQPYYLD
ncbi:MAG TPA: Gfo/Idh/MocA family oxidoreductase [Clostridia bacterium]|jgi:predicted dehydrogenase|nr:Gfo/Idh/MocA family oxidoreductase [Clostridia bacterium]HPY43652.1 Gfo/Idh/MocA family oxidoreductase [Clostridia bacterium]HQA96959.1 Gfo/Idh/MocA family oxidoreductase [Clostridia bacterium]HQO55516.1 Gfo/Idh/MocA family oxidoreductase [Clostridia bacterium]HUM60375.1 Gfo/Idh/MocA family oxidoreductase [Clostridia bacterium]